MATVPHRSSNTAPPSREMVGESLTLVATKVGSMDVRLATVETKLDALAETTNRLADTSQANDTELNRKLDRLLAKLGA